MSVFLRVDDFPGTKPEEFWKHNLDNFKRFDEVIAKHGIEDYVLGVIPKYTTEEHVKYLSENDRITVALHGIEHDERFPNEFRDWETEEQIYQKIVSATQVLQVCNGSGKIRDYIPPHNVIDRKTVNALQRAGYTSLLCGPGTDPDVLEYAAGRGMWTFYSSHPMWYGRSDELLNRDQAHEFIARYHQREMFCLTLHWTWEFNVGLHNLDAFLKEVAPFINQPED